MKKSIARLILIDCGKVSKQTRGFNGPNFESTVPPFLRRF